MTRKDYVLIAAALRRTAEREVRIRSAMAIQDRRAAEDPEAGSSQLWLAGALQRDATLTNIDMALADVVVDIADALSEDNPRFDKDMFYDAAGIDSTGLTLPIKHSPEGI